MRKSVAIGLTVAVGAVAIVLGAYVGLRHYGPDAPGEGAAVLVRTELPDLAGKPTTLAAWQGKVRVVNFWATWCTPCRKEIPGLIEVQRKLAANGVQVVGIAVDQADKVQAYAKEMGIDYPILVAGMGGADLSRKVGNRTGALPFTVVLDRAGKAVNSHLGIITAEELEKILAPLLAEGAKSG